MAQFEQEFNHQKEECQQQQQEISVMEHEMQGLRRTVKEFEKDKQEIHNQYQHQVMSQKQTLQLLQHEAGELKSKLKKASNEVTMQNKKILNLEKEAFMLENQLAEVKNANRKYKKELENYHLQEDTLRLQSQLSGRNGEPGKVTTIIINQQNNDDGNYNDTPLSLRDQMNTSNCEKVDEKTGKINGELKVETITRKFDPETVKFSPRKGVDLLMPPKKKLKLATATEEPEEVEGFVMRSPLARRPATIQTKKERIKQAQAREFNRRCTLANELDFPDAENFFSQDEFIEKEPSFIQEYSDEGVSPNQTPR